MRPSSPEATEAALADRIRQLLEGVPWLKGWQVKQHPSDADSRTDLVATLPTAGGRKTVLLVECKRELRPSVFASWTEPPASNRYESSVRVLGMPFVSPRLRDLCAAKGWSWFDLTGNHRLDVPGLLRLEHTGEKPTQRPPRAKANLATLAAGSILRVLLAPEEAGKHWTQRDLQTNCHPRVSIGLVNKVVRHLLDQAFLEEGAEGGFRLSSPLALLQAWRDVYRFDRHERLGHFTLLQGNQLRDALASFAARAEGSALYAAFSAAEFQAPHVRQPKTWLYVRRSGIREFERVLEAKPVDSGENLVVLIPQDHGIFHLPDRGRANERRMPCTNPVQTYLDLHHSGGRGQEAAEAVLEQRLKPAWKTKGLVK